jgi:hypothetical protein
MAISAAMSGSAQARRMVSARVSADPAKNGSLSKIDWS